MRELLKPTSRTVSAAALIVLAAISGSTDGFSPMALPPGSRQATNDVSVIRLHMFTGIVEEMGTVVALDERDDMILWDGSKGEGTELTVKGEVVMDGAYLG